MKLKSYLESLLSLIKITAFVSEVVLKRLTKALSSNKIINSFLALELSWCIKYRRITRAILT